MNFPRRMHRGCNFLGSRGTANTIRCEAEDALRARPDTVVVFDFFGVHGISHSFTDELVAPLSDLLGSTFSRRAVFENCTPEVQEAVELVCEMHGLYRPSFGTNRAAA